MHYAPHSSDEFLPGDHDHDHDHGHDHHHHHDDHDLGGAPLYFLAGLIGALIAADLLLGWEPLRSVLGAAADTYRAPFGVRLALIAAMLGGARIIVHTLEGLFSGRIGADLALTVATLAAIILREYFVASMVVFIATCGECLEAVTVGRAKQAVRKILELTPRIVHVLRDGQQRDVPLEELSIGEVIVVRPGERVAADGVVVAGHSAVDQSALTGESLPVDKHEGEPVYAGTLNQFGALEVHVEKLGSDTILGQVIRLVAEAAERKAPLERTADRYARYFLPVVLALAVITHLYNNWGASTVSWMPTLAVLVVACPCPLILATPAAVMAAMAWLASRGVVIKGSIALERLASVDTFVFDKTGTLTEGRLSLGDVRALGIAGEEELIRLAAAAEQRSEHPIARLLVHEAEGRNLVLPAIGKFTYHPGAGVVAHLHRTEEPEQGAGEAILVGNRRLMQQEGVELSEQAEQVLAELDAGGQTSLIVAVDGQVQGVIGARDTIRAEAGEMLHALHHLGIRETVLLTGDRRQAAESAAKQIGFVAGVEAEMLPADKAQWIEQARREGKRVAMVGDGVNDAPALALADVGLALGGVGSDIAAEAGDVVLMGDPLAPLPGLVRLARRTVQIIRQNIFVFAFGVNLAGVILTAWILPRWSAAWAKSSPVAAAIFHEFASLAVMLNAMRLLWFERWHESLLGRLIGWLTRTGDRLAAALDPRRGVGWILGNWGVLWRVLKVGVLGGAAVLFLCWNVTVVEPGAEAVVTRFGRYARTLKPGWHWCWPPPAERVYRQETARLRSIEIGFRTRPGVRSTAELESEVYQPLEWDNPHTRGRYERRESEALVFTGDEMLVELGAVVQYRISDLRAYLFAVEQPEEALRSAAESVIREIAAGLPLERILTGGRPAIEQEALERLQARLDGYHAGIDVVQVALQDVHPPLTVVRDFRDVASAAEKRQTTINEAQADYTRTVLEAAGKDVADRLAQRRQTSSGADDGAEIDDAQWAALVPHLAGEASKRVMRAQGAAEQRVRTAEGEAERFTSRMKAYHEAPELTGLRLWWEVIEKQLGPREKLILDPKISGRKQLFMADALNLPAVLGGGSSAERAAGGGAEQEQASPRFDEP